MSRSQPENETRNPAQQWLQWEGAHDRGYFSYWDRELKEAIEVREPFVFVVLDRLATVTGYCTQEKQGIYANEMHARDLPKHPLTVKVHGGRGLIAEGLWTEIKDKVRGRGGRFCQSIYVMKDIDGKRGIANIKLKGGALGVWFELEKGMADIYAEAIRWTGESKLMESGQTKYRVPIFQAVPLSDESAKEATKLDEQLQAYLADYLGRDNKEEKPKSEPTTEKADEPKFDPHHQYDETDYSEVPF